MLLGWEDDPSVNVTNLKEICLKDCCKWLPIEEINEGKYVASASVLTGTSRIIVVSSFDYVVRDQNVVQPKFTAYVSEKKVIIGKFL